MKAHSRDEEDKGVKILDMPCPHGWNNCTDCKNVDLCKVGLYKPEYDNLPEFDGY